MTRYAKSLTIEIADLARAERAHLSRANDAEVVTPDAARELRERAEDMRRRKEVLEAKLNYYRRVGRIARD